MGRGYIPTGILEVAAVQLYNVDLPVRVRCWTVLCGYVITVQTGYYYIIYSSSLL